jgi:hypothetical protein
MRTKLISLFIVVILFASSSLQATNKINLRLNFKKGSIYEMTAVLNNITEQNMMDQKSKIIQKMETVFSFTVLKIMPNKNFLIEYSIKKVKMNIKMNDKEMYYDSESVGGDNPINNILKTLPAIKMEINRLGKIIHMDNYDLENLKGDQKIVGLMHSFLANSHLQSFFGQMFNYFPGKKIKKADKWTTSVKQATVMDLETIMTFEIAAFEKNQITLKVTSDVNSVTPIEQGTEKVDVKMMGKQNGSMTIDTSDGWLRSSKLTQKFDLTMKSKNPTTKEDMDVSANSNSVTTITIVKK